MGLFSLRTMENMESGSNSAAGCNYSSGPQYVGCQVAARGWPTPQYMNGGRKSSCKRKYKGGKRTNKAKSRGSRGKKRGKKRHSYKKTHSKK